MTVHPHTRLYLVPLYHFYGNYGTPVHMSTGRKSEFHFVLLILDPVERGVIVLDSTGSIRHPGQSTVRT